MLIDSSVLVALICEEEHSGHLLKSLALAKKRTTTAIAVAEAALAVGERSGQNYSVGTSLLNEFISRAEIQVLPIPSDLSEEIAKAYERYGPNSAIGVEFSMGDLITYAVAKRTGSPLLSTKATFGRTDVEKVA